MSKEFQYNKGPLDAVEASSPRSFLTTTAEFGVYLIETTQRFVYGTRYITWDGRVYKYSLSSGAIITDRAASSETEPFIKDDGATEVGADTIIGDTSIIVPLMTVAEDALAGGYLIIYSTQTQTRGIIGNTVGAGTTITIYLDGPLTGTTTKDTTDICAYYSPYYGLQNNPALSYGSSLCVAATAVALTGYNFWGQTWGPCRVTPGIAGFGAAAAERQMVFDSAGSLREHSTAMACDLHHQHAGFIIPNTGDTSGAFDDAPLVMLQISI